MAFPSGAIPGIDVSHYQAVIDWDTVTGGGERFAFAKASEGAKVQDQYFADNWLGMKTSGLLRGAYHFYHPNSDPGDQAQNFLQCLEKANGGVATLAAGDLPVALDIEVTDGLDPATLLAGAAQWLATIQAATGKQPLVYTYVSFWQTTLGNPPDLSNYPLWVSHPNVAAPTVPGGWTNWIFWQFGQQPLPGVPSLVTDLDAFNGAYADLQSLAA
jgi:lysozyme